MGRQSFSQASLSIFGGCIMHGSPIIGLDATVFNRIWIRAPPTVYSGYKGVNGNLIVTLCSQVNNKASHQVSAFCVKYLSSYGKKCKSVQTWRKNEVKVSTTVTGLGSPSDKKKTKTVISP